MDGIVTSIGCGCRRRLCDCCVLAIVGIGLKFMSLAEAPSLYDDDSNDLSTSRLYGIKSDLDSSSREHHVRWLAAIVCSVHNV